MSIYVLKFILSLLLLLSGIIAALSMLTLMGRAEKKSSPEKLRRIHKRAGYFFALFLLLLGGLGAKISLQVGDALALRPVLHGFLALFLLFIFFLKLILVRFYKQFLRMAPTLGMSVLVLAFVVFSVSGGYFLLRFILAYLKIL